MTVRVNGAGALVALTPSGSPVGLEANVSTTVFGCSRTLFVFVRPPASLAVRRSSRWLGYSWSGAVNEPVATPVKVWMTCSWQFDGQWCMISVHVSADAGSVPCCGSVADPEKPITSPTFQVREAGGEDSVADGGVLAALIVSEAVPLAPSASVTRRRTVRVPGVVYVKTGE